MLVEFNLKQHWEIVSVLNHQTNPYVASVVLKVVQNGNYFVIKFAKVSTTQSAYDFFHQEMARYQSNIFCDVALNGQVRRVHDFADAACLKHHGADDHSFVLILPYVKTLSVDVIQNEYSDLNSKIQLFIKMCNVVERLHDQSYIHGDLKLDHFGVHDEKIKILDLASISTINHDNTVEIQGGTPAYMAPELYLGASKTIQSDVYAMGIIFYQLVVGEKPYSAQNYYQWAKRHCQKDIPLLPTALKAHQSVLDQMLAKHQKNRFLNLNEVKNALNFI